jgi:tetratricopeptide (TPR) repeat protein
LSVIEKEEKSDSCSLLKGQILMKLNNFDEATKSLESLKKRKDSLGVVALYNLAEIKESQADTVAAIDLYIKAGEKDDFGEICEKARAKEEIFKNISLLKLKASKKNSEEGKKEEGAEQEYQRKDSSYIFFRIGELYYWDLNEKDKGVEWYRRAYEEFPESSYAPKAIFTRLSIELKEDSTLSTEASELFSMLINKYPETEYSKKAKELYGYYFQDTTGSRK